MRRRIAFRGADVQMIVCNQISEHPVDEAGEDVTSRVGWPFLRNTLKQFWSSQQDAAEGPIPGRIFGLLDELSDCAFFVYHDDARSARIGNPANTQGGYTLVLAMKIRHPCKVCRG